MKIDKPTISICTIVKDEEKQIADFLSCLVDFADEIIIVDTESSDQTVDIIHSFIVKHDNIKLYKYKSTGIFHYGRAKNFSIQQSTKDFSIILDADERLSSDFKMRVRYFLRDNSPEVAKVKRVDEVVPHLIDYLERIIKNNLGIFFRSDEEGRVHEQLDYKKNSEAFDGVIWHQQRWNHYIYRPQRILFQLELQIERTPKTKSFFGHVFRGIWYFNFRFKKLYFKKCLYKDGKLGLKYSFMRALDAFLVEFFVGLKPRVNNKYWSEEK